MRISGSLQDKETQSGKQGDRYDAMFDKKNNLLAQLRCFRKNWPVLANFNFPTNCYLKVENWESRELFKQSLISHSIITHIDIL